MRQIITLVLTTLCFAVDSSAQITANTNPTLLQEIRPSHVAMSNERLNRIDAMLKEAVDTHQIPGVVALIVRNGRIVYHKAHGKTDERGTQFEKNAIFRIASQTKAITATAVMILWEEGRFQLDDPHFKVYSRI